MNPGNMALDNVEMERPDDAVEVDPVVPLGLRRQGVFLEEWQKITACSFYSFTSAYCVIRSRPLRAYKTRSLDDGQRVWDRVN